MEYPQSSIQKVSNAGTCGHGKYPPSRAANQPCPMSASRLYGGEIDCKQKPAPREGFKNGSNLLVGVGVRLAVTQ